ncbi:MAG: quinone-dependent dihydroorotate dehydrogenase [Opitutales bacterium]|nr:quinone-dependent dihydroorotate dehydrogenase [Opitutales bacterium]
MSILYEKVLSKAFYAMDPELAHQCGLHGMGLIGSIAPLRWLMERGLSPEGAKPVNVFGLKFPNHVGLAAGFDKDGSGWRGAAALGFGHVEVGTVTRHAQAGNEKPRVWRYPQIKTIVNAYGFPNLGAEALRDRLKNQPGRGQRLCPLGINIGKSKITPLEEAQEDYLFSFKLLAPYADYLVVNISSPNTPGLRALQDREPLIKLLRTLTAENKNTLGGPVPLLLKVAPDLNPGQLEDILSVVSETKFAGIIATNTTITRPHGTEACETRGGLSGKPLLEKSLQVVRFLSKTSNGKIPIIGCGGITSAVDAGRFMDEGACLVQVYSGLVFRGPGLAKEIAQGLAWRQRTWI